MCGVKFEFSKSTKNNKTEFRSKHRFSNTMIYRCFQIQNNIRYRVASTVDIKRVPCAEICKLNYHFEFESDDKFSRFKKYNKLPRPIRHVLKIIFREVSNKYNVFILYLCYQITQFHRQVPKNCRRGSRRDRRFPLDT